MAAAQDNLACKGTGMNWYTSMVGETPCQTYQKLRQICNSQFTVGVMNPNTPPDFCTDQVSTCCCNNIAFSLAMLCLKYAPYPFSSQSKPNLTDTRSCQQDIGTGSGLDAGVGAYQIYLNGSTGTQSCANPQSGKLPNDIQTAACNQKIKINNDIYTNGWPDGSWFYVFTRDTIVKDNIVANNNSFTHCASTTINTSSSSSASGSKTASSNKPSGTQAGSGGGDNNTNATSKSSSLATGAIAGIAVGAAVLAIAAVLAFWFCRKRQRRTQAGVLGGPFEGRSSAGGGRETAVLNDSLVAHGAGRTAAVYAPVADWAAVLSSRLASSAYAYTIPPPPPVHIRCGSVFTRCVWMSAADAVRLDLRVCMSRLCIPDRNTQSSYELLRCVRLPMTEAGVERAWSCPRDERAV
ncbi:hypothetical protein C8R43DRAFT_1121640 [Mycena crocata]|nr:hypothetical protein C8R43DRAFT_1121640 [Mycena crocata]